jgi:hypothetical protein
MRLVAELQYLGEAELSSFDKVGYDCNGIVYLAKYKKVNKV